MTLENILGLLGGLALFLYGMKMMSDGLEQAAGNRMKTILEKLTTNRIAGVLTGAGITAVIQSSSATTVMVVGFVNSGIMTLRQAIWVIMGANIGTTITGQLIALDVGALAPLMAIVGVVLIVFLKSKKLGHIGGIIGGLGMLFIGMDMMGSSMAPLRDSQVFVQAMTQCANPFLGILVGALFTALIQSSSASVGILQALATSGAISLGGSVYILFGQNIGTCITAVLASIGTNRAAKRTTAIHLMFNIIGTAIFLVICSFTPFVSFMEGMTPDNPAAQIANVHTTFNVVTTLLLLPFGSLLELAAKRILPEKKLAVAGGGDLQLLSPDRVKSHAIGSITVAISQIQTQVQEMYRIACDNVILSFDSVTRWNRQKFQQVLDQEEKLDSYNAQLSRYISQVITVDMPQNDGRKINAYFKIIGNIERIGDHAMNIAGYASMLQEKGLSLSAGAQDDLSAMRESCLSSLQLIDLTRQQIDVANFEKVAMAEQQIDDLTESCRQRQLERMRLGECSGEVSVVFSEMITDYERIGDHLLNIGEALAGLKS